MTKPLAYPSPAEIAGSIRDALSNLQEELDKAMTECQHAMYGQNRTESETLWHIYDKIYEKASIAAAIVEILEASFDH